MIVVACNLRFFLLQEVGAASVATKLLQAFLLIPLFAIARYSYTSAVASTCNSFSLSIQEKNLQTVGIAVMTLRVSISCLNIEIAAIGYQVAAKHTERSLQLSTFLDNFLFGVVFQWPIAKVPRKILCPPSLIAESLQNFLLELPLLATGLLAIIVFAIHLLHRISTIAPCLLPLCKHNLS